MRLIPFSSTPAVDGSNVYTGNFETGPIDMREICPDGTRGKTIWVKYHKVGTDYDPVKLIGSPDLSDVGYCEGCVSDLGITWSSGAVVGSPELWISFVLGKDYPFLQITAESGDAANTIEAWIVV